MKIVTVTKTLNEERNIAHFCAAYEWADMILIADGGSEDDTLEIAGHFPNVHTRDFDKRVDLPDGSFMNPEPEHLNFIIEWAIQENADWIILDGADCWPNPALERDARGILEKAREPAVHLHRLYLWGQDEYFPKYNRKRFALWAWRPGKLTIACEENGKTTCFDAPMLGIEPNRALNLPMPPYCCLHHFAPDEATVQFKMKRYAAWGHPQVHPLESIYAPARPLPGWVYEL